MRSRQSQPSLLSALGIALIFSTQNVAAVPYPKDNLHEYGYGYLMPRQCDNYCGYNNMYCCSAGSVCYTSNGIAGCTAAAGGGVAFYTTTWTSTGTFTSTMTSYFPAATTNSGNCIPPKDSGQKACGSICCASWQYCAFAGQCVAGNGGPASQGLNPGVSSGGPVTTPFVPPYRVTSGGTVVPTTTGTAAEATTTSGGVTPGGGGTAGGGLSPGAIAGIVIGTLAGIVLLILLCFCCIVRGLWHGLLAILGIGKKREKEIIIEEERRSSSRHSRRHNHGSWYGGGGRPSTVASRKEKSSGKGLLGLGAALGTLWLLLGLKKDKKKKGSNRARSDVSSSYWSSSYTADSPSSLSSDRRTRRSHRSGPGSRTSRVTRTTRVSRVSRGSPPRSPRSPPR
ncbi:hypothetical protein QBC47DRAFT_162286 [Echria macrotheca]|uniref:Uncharacterized protein n=1 Tax=Echria macrotheca TaxID=438768 RepID=A0AAJ0BG66_9PEZI|nr:hypothetical protein QBC47DRAFT_162286 [Echria macrotheca]